MEYLVGSYMVPLYGSRHPLCLLQLPTAPIVYSDSTEVLNILVDLNKNSSDKYVVFNLIISVPASESDHNTIVWLVPRWHSH